MRIQEIITENDLDEGWKEKLAAAGLAATIGLGAASGAQARVLPGADPSINRFTGKPIAAQQVQPGDVKKDFSPEFSSEYLKKVIAGDHPRPLISKEKAQELLDKINNAKASNKKQAAESLSHRSLTINEAGTGGSTISSSVGSIPNPHISPGPARGQPSYIGKPGHSGTKAPPQPKVRQPKKKDGTAVNALDMKGSLFGEGNFVKR